MREIAMREICMTGEFPWIFGGLTTSNFIYIKNTYLFCFIIVIICKGIIYAFYCLWGFFFYFFLLYFNLSFFNLNYNSIVYFKGDVIVWDLKISICPTVFCPMGNMEHKWYLRSANQIPRVSNDNAKVTKHATVIYQSNYKSIIKTILTVL